MNIKKQHIIVIGGGPAGLEAAASLCTSGYRLTILEKEDLIGGKLQLWHKLFPTFRPANEVKNYLTSGLKINPPEIITNAEVVSVKPETDCQLVTLADGQLFKADAVLIATGFQVYNAERKEEYGYKIYDNVITSVDLEEHFQTGDLLKKFAGSHRPRIAFIHCVGSRDLKAGNIHCSRVCCITGVKQAIEVKHLLPEAEIFNFYMDMRMFGQNFEEIYIEAQQKWGITFIRGRVSEIAENIDGSLQLKAEDTLSARPLKMNFDLVVLLVGIIPAFSNKKIGKSAGLAFSSGDFLACNDAHINRNETKTPGIFVTGTCREPLSIAETLTDAKAAAAKVISWLVAKEQNLNN